MLKYRIFHKPQERRPKPFLLFEIGMLRLRLHVIDGTRDPVQISLLREAFLTPGDGTHLLDVVREALDVETQIRDLAIVMNSPSIRHQVVSIPHMSQAERQKVLRLEMKNSSPSKSLSGAFSSWSAGKFRDQGVDREQVLCADINQAIADSLISAVREKNFTLIGFTSYALMASQLLKECRLEGSRNIALLEVSDREGSITLFHSNVWNMDRHFLLGGGSRSAEGIELSELDAEKLKLEVGRALQYFKQQVRSENISQIILFGTTPHAVEIKALIESSLRITVAPLILDAKRFATAGFPTGEEGSVRLNEMVHAAALHAYFERYINFLPVELHDELHSGLKRGALAGSAIALYALMAGLAFMMNKEASRITIRMKALTEAPLVHNQTEQRDRSIRINRSFAFASEKSDMWLRARHGLLAELARELAAAAPPQMRITGLEVTARGEAWRVNLTAEIRSPNGSLSQRLFLRFQQEMGSRACLKQLTWADVQLTESESGRDAGDTERQPESLLTFGMQGVITSSKPAANAKQAYIANP